MKGDVAIWPGVNPGTMLGTVYWGRFLPAVRRVTQPRTLRLYPMMYPVMPHLKRLPSAYGGDLFT